MRIAIVGNFGLTGKQTMAARAMPLAEALAARGHSVRVCLPIRCESDRRGPRERNGLQLRYADAMPRLGLLDLADHLVVHAVADGDRQHGHLLVDQRNRAVFHFACRVTFSVDIGNLFEF